MCGNICERCIGWDYGDIEEKGLVGGRASFGIKVGKTGYCIRANAGFNFGNESENESVVLF